jgi:hypothetical protein
MAPFEALMPPFEASMASIDPLMRLNTGRWRA